jgi:predicted Rossmann fold flavoprotein
VRVRLDLLPETDAAALDRRLQHDLAAPGKACYDSLLKGYVPRALGQVLITLSGIPGEQSLNQFTAAQRRQVVQLLKGLEVTVVGTRPIEEALVTLGGVSVREVAPRTLESRLVRGLYLAGELLDLAGDTGGYNLQIAFTTGWVAGTSSASM